MLLSSFLDSPRARRFLHCLIVAASVVFAVFFLYASLKRMVYPFELERVESGVLISMLRALHGQPIYVAPTVDYVPYLYAPVFYYLAAALTKITGIAGHGYAADRLLSILATIGSAACIYGLTLTTTRRRIAGIAAAGLFFACYPVLDTFYDVGRVDSLVVFFLLLALLLQRRGYPILAAVVWAIAFQTKQSVLPIGFVILCAEWPRRKQVFLSHATLLGLAAISVMLMNHAAHGWYNFYLFHIAGALPFLGRQATLFFPQMLEPMAVAWAILFAAIILTLKTPQRLDEVRAQLPADGVQWEQRNPVELLASLPKGTEVPQVLQRCLAVLPVADVAIEEPTIEEVVKSLYGDRSG